MKTKPAAPLTCYCEVQDVTYNGLIRKLVIPCSFHGAHGVVKTMNHHAELVDLLKEAKADIADVAQSAVDGSRAEDLFNRIEKALSRVEEK